MADENVFGKMRPVLCRVVSLQYIDAPAGSPKGFRPPA